MSNNEPSPRPQWECELEFLIQEIKDAITTSHAFATKIKLEGYLLCAFNAKLIDQQQLNAYSNQINSVLHTKLF